jgi:mono/diheme cytochrome c family protein
MHVRIAMLPVALGLATTLALASCSKTSAPTGTQAGEALYQSMCKGCHGGQGEGGSGPALRDWSKGRDTLVSTIATQMPLGNASACDGECASAIADYILATFVGSLDCTSPKLVARGMRLLTTREYQATLADLVGVSVSTSAQPAPTCGVHTFSYVAQGSPSKVHVAGSFNGWPGTIAAGGWAMTLANGTWSVTKQLSPGTYQYKLVLDESQWITDPSNPKTAPDGFGGNNSVLDVTCPPAPATLDVGKNLPPDTRPQGFLFDDDGPGRVVTSVHTDEYLRSAQLVAKAADLAKLVTCDGKADPAGCAHAFVASFGQSAFRRPLTANEAARLEKLVTSASDFATGVRTAIAAMLVSPGFLYRSEVGVRQPDGSYRLTPWETASLLSYTFWGTMPDAELFAAASSGDVMTPAGLEKQARRLLASPRARAQLGVFGEQWLGSETISTVDKNANLYPDFDANIRAAMREETREVVERIFLDTRHVADLYTANWTMANDVLAKQYGIPNVQGSDMRLVTYPDGMRSGVLGHGSILGATGLSDQTSPIRRGLFVRRRLLCQDFPQPPPNAGGLPPVDPNATTRERFAQHTANPFCKSCHQYIDDLGFGFERFDTVGRQRDTDSGQPVDSTGDMNDVEGLGTGTHAPFTTLSQLGQTLAASDSAKTCVARQYWRFARGTIEPDSCSIAQARAKLVATGDPVEMMIAVVLSPDFLVRQ